MDFNKTTTGAPTGYARDQNNNKWLTQGSSIAPDMTHKSVARKNLDLDSVVDLASNNEHEMDAIAEDPLLSEALKDYENRTHTKQYQTMEALMKPRRRLIDEEQLPPINFPMQKQDIDGDSPRHIERH